MSSVTNRSRHSVLHLFIDLYMRAGQQRSGYEKVAMKTRRHLDSALDRHIDKTTKGSIVVTIYRRPERTFVGQATKRRHDLSTR